MWLRTGAPWEEVNRCGDTGLLGNPRFTYRARRAFYLLHAWGAPRFSGHAGAKQELFFSAHGAAALDRRIARARRIIASLSRA